ncbi:MAG: hypothetical protein E6R03_15475 [Hyphomicrobiaceae bacterium]|nr:MAG: hypothetical protein E6R03_15475 [Hyphomicrobiaceae bacterium]
MIELAAPALILPERPALVRAHDMTGIPSFEEMQARQKGMFPFPVFCPGGTWVPTFSQTLAVDQTSLQNYSFRTVIPAGSISTSGTTIRATLQASSSASVTFDNVSIVERSGSTVNGTTAPTALLFSGGASVTVSAGSSVVSDALSYTLDETKDYLLICDIGSSNGGTVRRDDATFLSYYAAAANSWNVQSPGGFSSAAVLWNVSKLEVFV